MKRLTSFCFVLLLISFLVACDSEGQSVSKNNANNEMENGNNEAPQTMDEQESRSIDIYTFSSSSTTYLYGVQLAELINEHSDWLTAQALESPGANQNTQLVIDNPEMRTQMIGFMWPEGARNAYPPFDAPFDEIYTIGATGRNFNGFITTRDDIDTIYDLEGRRVAVGAQPSAIRVDLPVKALELMGIDANLQYMDIPQGVQALTDGSVDALLVSGSTLDSEGTSYIIAPGFTEIVERADNIKFLSYDADAFNQAVDELFGGGLMAIEIPPNGLHEKQNEPFMVGASTNSWYAHKDMPEDIVYEITRIYVENAEVFGNVHASGNWISAETIADVDEEWIHPGALKYYQEAGLK